MKHPPVLQASMTENSADDPEALMAYSRDEATNMVQDHLDNHLEHNPGRSSDYVTWIATLHPENAEVSVDQRFFIPGNPWWTIYEDRKNNIPTATAVAINEDDPAQPASSNNGRKEAAPQQHPSFCLVCSPVDTFAGIFVVSFAIFGVLLSELFALFLCYVPGFILFHIASLFSPPNVCTGLFYSFFMIFYYACALGDSICLVASVLVTEIVAGVGWIVSCCTGGVLMARFWHQYIRRICHGIRIGLRNKKYFSRPTRDFILWGNSAEFEAQASGGNAPVEAVVHRISPNNVTIKE